MNWARTLWTSGVVFAAILPTAQCGTIRFLPYDEQKQPPTLSCYADEAQTCWACLDRRSASGCSWCSDANGSFCCAGTAGPNAMTGVTKCGPPPAASTLTSCGGCKAGGYKWCGTAKQCVPRGDNGTFPPCDASVEGTANCP